jgi:hypothetical protein
MSDPLDELLRALRSPALPAEHARRTADVDAMHAAAIDSPEPAMSRPASLSHRRRLPVATVIAAGVLGFAGVAAAGPGGFFSADAPDVTTTTVASETSVAPSTTETTETTVEPTTTAAPSTSDSVSTTETSATPDTTAEAGEPDGTPADVALVDDPDTEFDETQCADGNHGQTVSSVAQSVEPGPGHGEAVSDAAHSSCGKDADDPDDEDTPDVTTAEAPTTTTSHGKPDDVGSQGDEHRNGGSGSDRPPAGHGKPDDPGKPKD